MGILPGKRLSLQCHRRRSEHWTVVQGIALVTRDTDVIPLGEGGSVDLPVGTVHSVNNPGHNPLVFIEVQTGDHFGEEDIERLKDDYGRV